MYICILGVIHIYIYIEYLNKCVCVYIYDMSAVHRQNFFFLKVLLFSL